MGLICMIVGVSEGGALIAIANNKDSTCNTLSSFS